MIKYSVVGGDQTWPLVGFESSHAVVFHKIIKFLVDFITWTCENSFVGQFRVVFEMLSFARRGGSLR